MKKWQCFINSQLLIADLVATKKRRKVATNTTSKKSYIHFKLCSLHFKSEDFITDSSDQKTWRKTKKETLNLIRRKRRRKDA